MADAHLMNAYQNLFMTVPDRTGLPHEEAKKALRNFLHKWRSDYNFLELAREPFKKPTKEGWTHHIHVGMCFDTRVRILGLAKAANSSKHFSGLDLRQPLVARGKSANVIFTKYFHDPSKYKSLDEFPMLVRNRGPRPLPVAPPTWPESTTAHHLEWGQRVLDRIKWNVS